MPKTDGLMPPGLSKEAKDILKSYGGWTMFMASYGLKVGDSDDTAEGEAIVKELAKKDAETKKGGGGD